MASIRRLSSGKWQAQVRRAGLPGRARSFAQRADAIQWARTLERGADRGIYVDCCEADRTMLAELIDRYLAEVTPLKKSAVFELRRLRPLKKYFGSFSASQLQAKHIASYRDERLRQGTAGATVTKDLNSLSHILDVAIRDWGLPLPTNPVKLVRRPPAAR